MKTFSHKIIPNKRVSIFLKSGIIFIFSILHFSFSHGSTYYFSSSHGDDSYSRTEAQNPDTPWKSLNKLNSISPLLKAGDEILFKCGDTFFGKLLISKSGSPNSPIKYGSYGSGEKPIITSLKTISNWVKKGDNIYEADLEVSGDLNIVILNGIAQALGRYPNSDSKKNGYLTISSVREGHIGSKELHLTPDFTGGEVVIRKNNWIIDRHKITQHSGSSINFDPSGSNYSPHIGFGFFIQNHPKTLDQNGEWYYDKLNRKLHIFFQGDISSAAIQVAINDQVIDIKQGISNVFFSDIAFLGANENLVTLSNSSNIIFSSTELKFAGMDAINSKGSKYFTIENSFIEDTYNSGIFFQWNDKDMKIVNNTFNRNYIFPGMSKNGDLRGNTIYMSADSGNGLIEKNRVLNSGYQGINFNGNNTIVQYNLIDTFCFVKDDGAGIYTYTGAGNENFENRKVINNIVLNGIGAVNGTKPYGPNDFAYVEGIYIDDNSSNVEIIGNTIANIPSGGIYIHNSRKIVISQNQIFNSGNSIKLVHDDLGEAITEIQLKNNQLVNMSGHQSNVFIRSKSNDIKSMGEFDENIIFNLIDETNSFLINTSSKTSKMNLQSWISNYNFDKNSNKNSAKIKNQIKENENQILFEFNFSDNPKALNLSGNYLDLNGDPTTGTINIPPYSSVLLFKN